MEKVMKDKKKKSLLLVEDEGIIALHKKVELEEYGYDVVKINTGEKAVKITESKSWF
jgi:response regulator RpfG family c-di-GMP phosphodiesterase